MRPSVTSVRDVIDLERYKKYLLLALQSAGVDLPSLLRGLPGSGVTPFPDTDFFFSMAKGTQSYTKNRPSQTMCAVRVIR